MKLIHHTEYVRMCHMIMAMRIVNPSCVNSQETSAYITYYCAVNWVY